MILFFHKTFRLWLTFFATRMKKLRELLRSRSDHKEDAFPESCEEEIDGRPVLGMHSKTLGIPPISTRPSRASKVHSMLVLMREQSCQSNTEPEEGRYTNVHQRTSPVLREITCNQQEKQRSLPNKKWDLKKDKSKRGGKGSIPFKHQSTITENKENIVLGSDEHMKEQIRKSNHLFKLSTQGELKGSINRTVAPAYRRPSKVENRYWSEPTQPYACPCKPSGHPPPATPLIRESQKHHKPPPNCSYWTGDITQDDQTLLNMLQKYDRPLKTKKQVRFNLPSSVRQVRFDEQDFNCERNYSLSSEIQRPLRRFRKNSITSVQKVNYFGEVWTLLEDLFSDETVPWINGDTDTEGVGSSVFSTPLRDMARCATIQSRKRVQLLSRGFDEVEILFNIPKPGARLKSADSRGFHQVYSAAKEQLLAQAFSVEECDSSLSACFTHEYSPHWAFLCCLLVDALLRKRVLRREYAQFDESDNMWENERTETGGRVYFWESRFEVVVGEVLGGDTVAGQLLSLREYSLLRQFFDHDDDDLISDRG